ncbi:MAG: peroxiredoxin [Hyphomicrobiaceae bacterium]
MPTAANPNLLEVDWSKIPAPEDDGAARHLTGLAVPDLALPATDGNTVSLARLAGRTVVYAYPRTGRPGQIAFVENWDTIPGARGCTPQSCAFRDRFGALSAAGVAHVFGVSTQDTEYQREAVQRLHLPFPLLSDADLSLTKALTLPTMTVAGRTLLKRFALVLDDGRIAKVFYPVFPPDRNVHEVLAWLAARQK